MNRAKIALCLYTAGTGIVMGGGFLASPISPYYQEYHAARRELDNSEDGTENERAEIMGRYNELDMEYSPFFYKCAGAVVGGFSLVLSSFALAEKAERREVA